MSFASNWSKSHIKSVGEEPPLAELNFSMKWVGIIFKTGRNARGKAEKARNARKSKQEKRNQKLQALVLYHIRQDQITNYWAGEEKEQCMSAICIGMQSVNVKKSKLGKAESPNFFDVKEPLSDSFTQCIISA